MKTLVLASTSPRRKHLLECAGLKIHVFSPEADETPRRGESPKAMVARLAREKADSLVSTIQRRFKNAVILAADTIVVAPNGKQIFGKPQNHAEAFRMLRALSNQSHTVLTGYCLIDVATGQRLVRVIRSSVTMRALTDSQIKTYIRSGEPMDKAGAYAAQGIGQALISSIRGSYTNVVGLPLSHVLADMEGHFGLGFL